MSFVILHGDYRRLCRAPFPIALQAYFVVKLEWQIRKENRVFRSAKLHHRRFLQPRIPGPQSSDLHGDANRTRLRKEPRQTFRATLLAGYDGCFVGSSHAASHLIY
jgi:hypothetical protein